MARIVARLAWTGDPGVFAVRHAVECPRAATHVVPPLSRRADGSAAGGATGRPALEHAGRSDASPAGRAAPGDAAGTPSPSARLSVDSGPPRRRPAGAAQTAPPGPDSPLRRDPA